MQDKRSECLNSFSFSVCLQRNYTPVFLNRNHVFPYLPHHINSSIVLLPLLSKWDAICSECCGSAGSKHWVPELWPAAGYGLPCHHVISSWWDQLCGGTQRCARQSQPAASVSVSHQAVTSVWFCWVGCKVLFCRIQMTPPALSENMLESPGSVTKQQKSAADSWQIWQVLFKLDSVLSSRI